MPLPSSRSWRAMPIRRSTSTPESAAVGSSMMMTFAPTEIDLAISTTCWSAIERPRASRSGSIGTPRRDVSSRVSLAHPRAVEGAEPRVRLAADEHVLRDRQVGEQRGLLVDDGDAGSLSVAGAVEVDALAVEQELAAVAAVQPADDLDERRLAGAVLADEGVDGACFQLQVGADQRLRRRRTTSVTPCSSSRGGVRSCCFSPRSRSRTSGSRRARAWAGCRWLARGGAPV